ncbi:hypothetical protein H9Q08_17355 [Chryseobacterium sp. PS-8]|uniref:Uncharacterized protein n=1 Tax=Chryseobacterium indicum TaxID=2766954 RepID=A0ABS9CCG3_9FLAO|nr:hypothetical protein [Chryseobacterium sp. PS-8]MCF2221056.1 hypothetical protein [Chryseobacterium sp. PS-8]
MDTNKQSLLKIFSVLLKKKAAEKEPSSAKTISPVLIKYFSRKELVEMVSQTYGEQLPEGKNLLELENEEILNLIESDFQIIIYMCEKWLKEEQQQKQNPAPALENNDSSAGENQSTESLISENTEESSEENAKENSSSDTEFHDEVPFSSGDSPETESLSEVTETSGEVLESTDADTEHIPATESLKNKSSVPSEALPESGSSEDPDNENLENENSQEPLGEENTAFSGELSGREQHSPEEENETASEVFDEDVNNPETENEESGQQAGSSFSSSRPKNKNKKHR